MAKKLGELRSFIGGISNSNKIGPPYSFAFGRGIDVRSDPAKFTLNPQSINQTGSLVRDLPMWMDKACNNLYAYGNTGYIYQKDVNDNWTIDHLAPQSQGNGICYFPEDSYLYYAQNTTIGRRSNPCGSGTYYDGFLESEGGAPTNTASILFASASSQYAWIASQASLQITGDISMEAYLKPTSLPAATGVYTIMGKWLTNGNQRSYKFDITTSTNVFGDGRDGALTISADTTEAPLDANCTGTSGQYTLTTSNEDTNFTAGNVTAGTIVLIHQSRGSGSGTKQVATVQSFSGHTLTLTAPLTFSPVHSATSTDANKAQVRVLKQYTSVTVNAGITYTCKAWNGFKGGIIGWKNNGTRTINGKILGAGADGIYVGPPDGPGNSINRQVPLMGFGGGEVVETTGNPPVGDPVGNNGYAFRGEGTGGSRNIEQNGANGNGGGGAGYFGSYDAGKGAGGGGGGNGTAGATGTVVGGTYGGVGGGVTSSSDGTMITFGGGGGGGVGSGGSEQGTGGAGGAMGIFWDLNVVFGASGSVNFNGGQGAQNHSSNFNGGGGGGGAYLQYCQTGDIGTNKITCSGGAAGWKTGGAGGDGIVVVYYSSTIAGTASPTANFILDSTLAAVSGYVLRLLISSNGTNSEIYSTDITSLVQTGQWARFGVAWTSSTSTAVFYRNGKSIDTKTGAFTAIFASTAKFAVGASFDGSGAAIDFLDSRMDDARLWNRVRTATEMATYCDRVLTANDANLSAYYQFENNVQDSQTYTTNANLAAVNTPTYSSDVPFSGITTRADQDTSINAYINASGNTYTLPATLSEGATDRQTFQPLREPIKSIMLNVNTVGTGDWTVKVHDGLNREVATLTVVNAQMRTGLYEFVFSSSFRPTLSANYHVHVYQSTADGKIVSSSLNDMEGATIPVGVTGAYLAIFYQILVSDSFHAMTQFLNFVAITNERYVATLQAGSLYNPHTITLPAGYRARCFAVWNEFLVIGTWKGTTITDSEEGRLFFWNGTDSTYAYSVPIPEGGVNAMFGSQGQLYIIAGYEGKLLSYAGGSVYTGSARTEKIDNIPALGRNEYMEVAPGAINMWRSILRIGATLNTNSTNVHQGVYGYGRLTSQYPYAMMFDQPLSIGDQQSSAVKVGCVYPTGQRMFVGWQNGNTYGIDAVKVTNNTYPTATIELLITDLGHITKRKLPLVFRADFEALVAGQTVSLKYKKSRESSWHVIPESVQSAVGAIHCEGHISDGLGEIQLACDVTNTATTSPSILQLTLEAEGEENAINA